ncbi:SDR family oxidoreductase [Kitasatospora atroaurantiaca]|uniref:NAD(P)H dehydrogenase (Quinone) n=1 Tax=Kitasatospora atroaurantiaca TaxID=285545 RepID=A0A561EU11_9ACTN|nr:SDR family oxidoreductase [Kitasatospora atroaurantiaca]TWE19098.1 NAD(P)H dehydrogenase (quinone) [Kitasatospora atroaurantiaca]
MIVVTGATGQLGRFVVEGLLAEVPASEVAVAVRSAEKAAAWAAQGVDVRVVDYNRPETLEGVFAAGDRVLLISGNEMGSRVTQHRAVIDAAKAAGVALLGYTGVLGGDEASFRLADEHKATEAAIRESGLPFVFLRNGWYTENYTADAAGTVERGVVLGSSGDGRVATATRRDYAAAAVAVLTGEGHENRAYELSGDVAWSFSEYAAELAAHSGKPVVYRNVSAEEHREVLLGAGLPEVFADIFVDVDAAIGRGDLARTTGDLARLIGRPTTPLVETVKAAL